jgi:hypothetical protein
MGGAVGAVVEAELVHDPVGFEAVGGAALVEDERLAHADERLQLGVDGLVAPRGLPEAFRGGAVGAVARRVLLVLAAEEVVVRLLLVRVRLDLAQIWKFQKENPSANWSAHSSSASFERKIVVNLRSAHLGDPRARACTDRGRG